MIQPSAAQRLGRPAFVMLWATVTVIVQLLNYGAISVIGRQSIWDTLDAAGQVLVLSTIAISWKWWWAAATIVGAAARDTAIVNFFPADNAWFVLPVVYFISRAPHWFVLRRYGNRSYAWLAVPLVASQAGTLIYSIARAQGINASPAEGGLGWLAPAAVSGVVFGIVEGAALVWIIEREFSPASTTLPAKDVAPTPAPEEASDVTSQLVWVRMGLVVVLLLAIPFAVPQLFVQTYHTPESETLARAFLYLVPCAVALGLLAFTRFLHAGFALAASASLILLVPFATLTVALTMLPGLLMEDDREQQLSYVSTMSLTVVLIVIAIQAIRGARRIPKPERWPWAWAAGSLGTILYGFAVFAIAQSVETQSLAQFGEMSQNDTFAVANIDSIARCARKIASESPGKGFPRSLRDMANGDTPCIDRSVAAGELSGYRYRYYPGSADARGVVRGYSACAEPIRYGRTGSMTVAVDETGSITPPYSADQRAISCAAIISAKTK